MSDPHTIFEWVAARDFVGKSDSETASVIWLIREQCRKVGLDVTERALLERLLEQKTGLKPKHLALPPAINVVERDERAKRLEAFADGDDPSLIDPRNGASAAEAFLRWTEDDAAWPKIVRFGGEFFRAQRSHYEPVSDEEITAMIYEFLDGKRDVATNAPIKPDRALVETILHAVKAAALIQPGAVPCWLGEARGRPDTRNVIPFGNGLLDLESRQLIRPTRGWFGLNARDFNWLPRATAPQWCTFLASVFGDDVEAIEAIAEWFGYLLTVDTSQQKALLVIGPPRSGKGTILRVLRQLLGATNVAAPTLAGLGGAFGLQGLVGKLAALISDARISRAADILAIGETILRVTGEDSVSVPRKFKDDWNGRLVARFVVVSNELPALLDQSGALSSRFVVIKLRNSFLGREDLGLTDRLLEELPGIVNWALDGLDRLRERGHFRQPASALDAVHQLEALASPVKAFIGECCALEAGASVGCGALYAAWAHWAAVQGRDHVGTQQTFGRDLAAALPGVRVTRPRVNGGRERHYEGVRLVLSGPRSDPLWVLSETEKEEEIGSEP